MKKFLFLLLAMIFAMQTWAQSTVVVADGTTTNAFLPVYGYWMDVNQHNQVIYPASKVTTVAGTAITKMTFHAVQANVSWGAATVTLKLGTSVDSNFTSATYSTASLSQVYSGSVSIVNNIMEIVFANPFVFTGGNLLVDITVNAGSYVTTQFYGETTVGGGIYQYSSNPNTIQDFNPKVTIEYSTAPIVITQSPTSINATSATLNGSIANITGTNYGFQYMLDASTDWTTATTVAATSNPMSVMVSSLLPSTTYRYRAFANDGTTNIYGAEVTFTTLAISATLPYNCDFENPTENVQWAFINGTQANQFFIGDASYNPDVNNTLGGTNALYITNDAGLTWAYSGASGASASRVYAYRDIEVPLGVNELKLTIDWKANGYGYGDLLRVYLVPTSSVITAGSIPPGALDISNALGTFYNNTNNNIQLNLATTWQTNEFVINTVQFPTLAGNTWRLLIHWRNENTGGVAQPPATVDNISLVQVTCATPTQLVASNATVNSVDLAWTENGTATTWNVEYKKSTESVWQTTVASTNPFTVTTLDPSSIYNFRVQAVCGTDVSLFTNAVNQATACAPVTAIPWEEGFEGITANNQLPPCWSATSLGSYTLTQIANYGSYNRNARTGSKSASFYYGCNDRFYTVGVQLTAGVSYDFSFWYVTDGYTGWNTLQSAVYSAQTTDSLIQIISTVTSPMNTTYQRHFGSFTPTVDGVYYFGVYCQSNYVPYYLTMDDFKVDESPACLGPINASAQNITPTTADVVFSAGDPTTVNYRVFWKEATATTWLQYDIFGDTTYQLTALTPNTIYNVKIAAECSDLTYSETTEFNFRTACTEIPSLPYSENFDSYGAGAYTNYPSCWTRLSNYGNYPYIYQYSYFSAPASLYLYSYNNTYSLATINDFDATIDINQLKVNFKIMGYSTSYNVKVGVMTNPALRSTFVQVGATQTLNNSSGTWEDKEVVLSSYTGTGRYITFLVEDILGSTNYIYLDNVVVDALPPCPDVYSFTTEVVSTTSFSASWDNSTDDGSGYILSYAVNPTTLPFDPTTGTQVTIPTGTPMPYTISSLNPGDTIYTAVQAGCGGNWTTTQSVILPTLISPVPYSCNFEDTTQNATWTILNGTQTNKWYIGAPGANGGTGNGLYISNDNGVTASYNISVASTVMASTFIQFNNAQEFALSFDWANYGESGYDYVIAYLVPLSYNITPGTMIPETYRITPNLNSSAAWQTRNVVLGSQYSNTVKRLVFQWRNDTSGGSTPPGLVDNVIINPLSCSSPNSLVATNVGTTTADLTWANSPTGAEFLIEYKLSSATTWNVISTLDSTFTLITLLPSSTYNARIKAVCTPGDTSFASNMVTFQTLCVAITPPTTAEPFLTMLPNTCWSMKTGILPATGNATLSPATYGWGIRTNLAPNTAYVNMYSTSCQFWLITPSVDLGTGTTTYQMDFDLARTAYYSTSLGNMNLSPNARFVVLISTDNGTTWNSTGILKDWNNSTGTPFSTLNNTLQSQSIALYDSVAMAPYSGIVKFAFFAYENDGSYTYDNDIHLDNFQVVPYNPCVRPTGVNATLVAPTTAQINWTETGTATSWVIEYGAPGFTLGTGTTVNAPTNPFVLTSLTPLTAYQYYVKSDCGGGSTSNWSLPGTFTTLPSCPVPTNFAAANITITSVDLSWTEMGTATSWEIEYGLAGFVQGTGTIVPVTLNPSTISTLTNSTAYDFYIRATCGAGDNSVWSSKITFSTPCLPMTLPLIEGFETGTAIPVCWTTTATSTNYAVSTAGTYPTCTPHGGTNMLYYNSYSTSSGNHAMLYSPLLNVTGAAIQVSYWQYRDPGYSSNLGEGIEVFYNTTASATGATSLGFTSRYFATAGWYNITYTIPAGLTGNAYIMFKAISEYGNNQFIDDISLTYAVVSCAIPTNLAISAINTNNATATWTAGGTETQWEIAYKATAASTWMTAIVNTTPSYVIPSLTAGTDYDVKVRAICAPGDTSAYTAIVNFTTSTVSCNTPTNLAAGTITNTGATITWTAGGTETSWEVDYKLATATTWTTVNATAASKVLTGLATCSNYNVRVRAVCGVGIFSSYTTVVNFNTLSPVPTNLQVTNITDQGALATWTAGGTENSWQVEYKLVSSANWTTATTSTPSYPLVSLQSNSLYEVRVKSLCSPNESVFTTPVQFTTLGMTFIITATAGPNGTITPSGAVTVNQGANQTFTFAPNTGYVVDVVTVDGTPIVGNPTSYTFNNVMGTHSINVDFTVGIDENELAQLVELFPNPTTSIIELRLKSDQLHVTECKVFDMYGKLMKVIPINAETTSIDVTDFASGVYFVRMDSERGTISKKFVKK